MSQKLLVNYFKQVKDISEFDESFIKNYNKERDEGYFFEVNVQCPEILHNLHNDLHLGVICQAIHRYAEANNKYKKDLIMIKTKNLCIFIIGI